MNQQVHFHEHAESYSMYHIIPYNTIYSHSIYPYRITKSVWIRKYSILYKKVTKIFAYEVKSAQQFYLLGQV